MFNRSKPSQKPAHRAAELLAMSHTVNGAALDGIDGRIVEVQARAVEWLDKPTPWAKAVVIVGMPADEAKRMLTRIGCAIGGLGHPTTSFRIVLSFHEEASGDGLALPAALAILMAAGRILACETGGHVFIGNLDVHGECRAVRGALPLALAAKTGQDIVCASDNVREVALAKAVRQCQVYPVADLSDAVGILIGDEDAVEPITGGKVHMESAQGKHADFAAIKGQKKARRAAEIAAAGGHSMILIGTPGSGKTMIANAIAGILPPLTDPEKVELTRIWSAAGLLEDGQAVIRRPFRAVHHSATIQSMIGGGAKATAGEVTLAHRGILFLDELPEFNPKTLDSLRQPMEDGCVSISRVHKKTKLPCRFSLVAAANPCPCGYAPNCSCAPKVIEKYQSRVSGPLMDRIDLRVNVEPVPLDAEADGESSAAIRARVCRAMALQTARYEGTNWHSNADCPGSEVDGRFRFSVDAKAELRRLAGENELSMRGHDRMAKVARTIADLAGSETVETQHVTEAGDYV